MYGGIDELGLLKYDHGNGMPEVFLRIRVGDADRYLFGDSIGGSTIHKKSETGHESYVKPVLGPVLICKCPVLSPGDIQMCFAVSECIYIRAMFSRDMLRGIHHTSFS